jgi:uncharacterized MAPEG superfamily protein
MTTPFWCLLIAIFLPYVFSGATAFFKQKQFGTLDNRHPRAQAAALEGPGARAYAAQANAWEALAVFVPSVLVAHLAGADPAASATASLAFIGFRVLHGVCYVADIDKVRSLAFIGATVCCLRLFWLAAAA